MRLAQSQEWDEGVVIIYELNLYKRIAGMGGVPSRGLLQPK